MLRIHAFIWQYPIFCWFFKLYFFYTIGFLFYIENTKTKTVDKRENKRKYKHVVHYSQPYYLSLMYALIDYLHSTHAPTHKKKEKSCRFIDDFDFMYENERIYHSK